MKFQMEICSILHFSWLILEKVVFTCKQAPAKPNASSREDYIPQILTVLLEIHRVYI